MPGVLQQIKSINNFWRFFAQKLRLSNPWNYKVPFLISVPYFIYLIGNATWAKPFGAVLASILIIIGVAGIGYLTNDLGDRKKDAFISKPNASANLSNISILFLFILFLAFALLPWFYLPFNKNSICLLCFEFLLFSMYAFPPFRLKEKNMLGIVADALYAHVNPAVLAAYTFYLFGHTPFWNFIWFLGPLIVWQFILGIRNIIFHQLKDHSNDLSSGTRTFVTSVGERKAVKLCSNFLLPLEFISFLGFVATVARLYPALAVLVIFYWLVSFFKNRRQLKGMDFRAKAYLFFDYLYGRWLPLFVLLLLCLQNLNFLPVLLLHLLLFKTDIKHYFLNRLKNSAALKRLYAFFFDFKRYSAGLKIHLAVFFLYLLLFTLIYFFLV